MTDDKKLSLRERALLRKKVYTEEEKKAQREFLEKHLDALQDKMFEEEETERTMKSQGVNRASLSNQSKEVYEA